jgi:integral membrane protein (TIGR00529 family)
MPAFLGLLPSLGGAIFSAPMVEHASRKYKLAPEDKATINYWFRHIWEFANPIIPGVLLASQITAIPLGTFVSHMAGYTLFALLLGCLFILTGKRFHSIQSSENIKAENNGAKIPSNTETEQVSWSYIFLALGPIIVNIILVVFFNMSAAISMGLVVLGMVIILRLPKKHIVKMITESFDIKLLWGIFSIMLFQHVLTTSGTVEELVAYFQGTNIPIAVMLGFSSLILGILTGGPQGVVAVLFPILTGLMPGSISTATTAYIMGIAGAMLSPAHLCLIVTGDYFKADIFKTLRPVLFLEIIIIVSVMLPQFF